MKGEPEGGWTEAAWKAADPLRGPVLKPVPMGRGLHALCPVTLPDGRPFSAEWHRYRAGVWAENADTWERVEGRFVPGAGFCRGRAWAEGILRIPRAKCLRLARVHRYLARRFSRSTTKGNSP